MKETFISGPRTLPDFFRVASRGLVDIKAEVHECRLNKVIERASNGKDKGTGIFFKEACAEVLGADVMDKYDYFHFQLPYNWNRDNSQRGKDSGVADTPGNVVMSMHCGFQTNAHEFGTIF
jgi:hypothetical protein